MFYQTKAKEEMPKCVIYADCGNDTTMILKNNEEHPLVIPTLLSKATSKMYYGAYLVRYEGEDYVIGDTNQTVNTNTNYSKMDLTHKLTLWTAIHQAIDCDTVIETLYVGMPIGTYYNRDYREEYKKFYKEGVSIAVNGVMKKFYVKNVIVLPESVGWIFTNQHDGLIGIVDIGHTTVDASVYQDCSPLLGTEFSSVHGASYFKTKLRDELNNRLLMNIQPYQIDEIIKKGLYGSRHDEAKEITNEVKTAFLRKIVIQMVEHGWELGSMKIVFTGGCSLILKDVIEEYEDFVVSENCLYDNLKGFKEMGVLLDE